MRWLAVPGDRHGERQRARLAAPRDRRGERQRARLILAAAVVAVAYRAAWYEPRRLVMPDVTLELPGWPGRLDGLRVALVSDLHAGAGHMTPARVAALIDAVLTRAADVHVLLGDYLDSTRLGDGRARARELAAELARLPSAVAVLGNHDWRAAGPAMGWALRDAGIPVLENDAVELREGLWVAGLADSRHRFPDLQATLSKAPHNASVLLLTHDPDVFVDVPARPALTLAGHLHGGQVNVPILRRAVLPTEYGERYLAGHVVERGRHLYVSAGLGTAGLPLRLRRLPEVPVLRLTAARPGSRAA